MDNERVFPETDVTKFVLRTKYAMLTESGTHEVVATFLYKKNALGFATATYGKNWRREFEVLAKGETP